MASSSNTRPPMLAKRRQTLIGEHPIITAETMDESYEPGEVIGTGSFGIIRKVTRRSDGILTPWLKILARKELNYGRMDERDLKQLTEEVNILEQLGSNDNIVRYYERFVDKPNNMLYILMEYCEGGDLAGVIQDCRKRGTLLPEDVVWGYLTQITLALSDCHTDTHTSGRGVILHRDIKPENVFLDKENNLKLGDFGLSKAMEQASMTQTYVGTPYYMSPELINGQPYDVKSDIWALGCLIYELCAGHPPFHEARTQPELAVMIREGRIPDLPKLYTAHLGQVVKAMLKQNPRSRPTTTQIKLLDSVRLQIRVIELRKATKDLRIRTQHIASREAAVLVREAAVMLREKGVQVREVKARESEEAFKEMQLKATLASEDRENVRIDGDALSRVAGRPSLVPRRPLEERRSSPSTTSIPFPRVASSSSLMSLDTPLKNTPSNRLRLASKSMYDLSAAGGYSNLTPSRVSAGIMEDSTGSPAPFGRRSASNASRFPLRRSIGSSDVAESPIPLRPSRPYRTTTVPTGAYSSPSARMYDDNDLPSPYLKKGDGMRMPSASGALPGNHGRPARISLGPKPSMGARFLASKGQALDEVGRRLSGAKGRLLG